MSKFCPNCGAMNEDNADFCSNCGTGFVAAPEKNSGNNSHKEETEKISQWERVENENDFTETISTVTRRDQENKYHESHDNNEENSSSVLLIIAIAVICLIGGIIAANEMGIINLFGNNKNTEITQSDEEKLAKDTNETEVEENTNDNENEVEPILETPKKSLDERAEDFIRWHYGELGNGNAYDMWDNYSKEFIRDCEKNKKPSLCDRSKFANLWRTARSVEVIDFRKMDYLNYKYSVKVTDASGNTNYYVTEMTLSEAGDGFLITWYNAS